jgi:uncharacterized protein (TIGR00661 family)
VPRIGFDHYGILAWCRPTVPWRDRFNLWLEGVAYRRLMGQPERVVVSSFYAAPPRVEGVQVVRPLLRREVRETPPRSGAHLLVYLNKGPSQFTPLVERALHSYPGPVLVYGLGNRTSRGNLIFRPLSNLPFVEDLAGCKAVVSTAGNQLVGEAMHFGKPMLVMPERAVEQRLNAFALEQMRIGMRTTPKRISPAVLKRFLARLPLYVERMEALAEAGWVEADAMLERFVQEIVADQPRKDSAVTAHANA